MSVLEQVQGDVRTAMKAGDRERAAALRMIVDALPKDAKLVVGDGAAGGRRGGKLGGGDEAPARGGERKKRCESADAYEGAGRGEQAATERREAELIDAYLP